MKSKPFNMERLFRALADRTRLRVLNLMGEQELCVCYFVEIFGISQPKVSRHLAYLRNAGLVQSRREGKWMHYRLAPPASSAAARILDETFAWMKNDPEMQKDRARLNTACCAPEQFVALQMAPRPAKFDPGSARD